jgi:phospholipid/cholesterol/gamma-HCH transport system substrate-binding protein
MRSRTIREGSVGLLILAAIGLFGFLVLWLRGIKPGQRSYAFNITFDNTAGMQVGTPVRYRGVPVGRILAIEPQANQVNVKVEISQGDLRIPAGVKIATTQSGLIGETSIDITPLETLSEAELALSPVTKECDPAIILCEGDRLEGNVGISYEDLLVSAQEIANFLTDPELVGQVKQILVNTNTITRNAVDLSDELTLLVQDTRKEVGPLALSAREAVDAAGSAARQIEISTAQSAGKLDITLTEVNALLTTNRGNISTTLDNIRVSSDQLRGILNALAPVIQEGEFIGNLQTLSANAAAASADLRDITASLNTTENLVLLQQTLESARDVFQSAQKIMADVDELTGDPAFRNNIRNLINGLGDLVSSTQRLETQTQLAQLLEAASQSETPPALSTPTQSPHPASTGLSTTALPTQDAAAAGPVLIYDGQRYTVRLADRVKESGNDE